METNGYFFLIAPIAVFLFGISKGGFGGSISMLAVPLLTLTISPSQAAALLLPILCVMDIFVIWTYRNQFDISSLQVLVPGALVGILLGYVFFEFADENVIKILIGSTALLFVASKYREQSNISQHSSVSGPFLGILSGFTSFIIHAGGPPLSMYLIPKKFDPIKFAGTAGVFFGIVNYVKLLPYYTLGQLNIENLKLSLYLMPIAPLGVYTGHWIIKRMTMTYFYNICYTFLFFIGIKLFIEGIYERFF